MIVNDRFCDVYLEEYTNYFTYKGSTTSTGIFNITIGSYDPVWVLVIPKYYSSISKVTVYATASAYASSSSSGIDINKTLAIECSIILAFFLIVVPIGLTIEIKIKRWQRRRAFQQPQNQIPPAPIAINYAQVPVNAEELPMFVPANQAAQPVPNFPPIVQPNPNPLRVAQPDPNALPVINPEVQLGKEARVAFLQNLYDLPEIAPNQPPAAFLQNKLLSKSEEYFLSEEDVD